MARQPLDYRELHAEADKATPRVARSLERGLIKAKEQVSIEQVALALQSGSMRAANALVERWNLDDPLRPAARILRDTVVRGARIGVKDVQQQDDG